MATVEEAKQLIPELCKQFYESGWVSGTGGGMSIRAGNRHVVAPSGVQKERMRPEDLFVLDAEGNTIEAPDPRPPPYKPPKLSECYPLFRKAYELRGAGAVLHSHSINAVLASMLSGSSEFSVTELEMIKGIEGHGYYTHLKVPIIENTARECELTESLEKAILAYPDTSAVLVRRHGVYVWGKDWIQAKTQAECYEYLFTAAVRLQSLGVDAAKPSTTLYPSSPQLQANGHANPASNGRVDHAPKRQKLSHRPAPKAVVLDIEGTVAPISFVKEVLFPYAHAHVEEHLQATFDSLETQDDLRQLEAAASSDATYPIPVPSGQGRDELIGWAAAFVRREIDQDRKSTALKTLQGRIWAKGYQEGRLQCQLYPDVVPALQQWQDLGTRVYSFSSGSRLAQRDLFSHTSQGDVRRYLSGYFDTTSGSKVEAASYTNIELSLGVDNSSDILFATDILSEAQAAAAAGWRVALTVRPGNKPLPSACSFNIVNTLAAL